MKLFKYIKSSVRVMDSLSLSLSLSLSYTHTHTHTHTQTNARYIFIPAFTGVICFIVETVLLDS